MSKDPKETGKCPFCNAFVHPHERCANLAESFECPINSIGMDIPLGIRNHDKNKKDKKK